ncbi:hypothetical protein RISK_002284 [Rhodopirellula islandica]|uniref:Uncharacterized protein n=1 Tax=Rhodopirellula islandica TaxID=595434 RepID=A0A0J1BGH8_RHOIS|nr:hypothetical protein RISK_002284 [Rhodopirellula islandica]
MCQITSADLLRGQNDAVLVEFVADHRTPVRVSPRPAGLPHENRKLEWQR